MTSTVGVIVNPQAGKDIRRLASAASHTSDVAKIGIVRRAVLGAIEAGVSRILLSADRNNLAQRAVDGLDSFDVALELLPTPGTGSRHDTIAAAVTMRDRGAGAVVVLGGDGTCRDVAAGWPDVPCIAISTGTNNVFPIAIDATSAGLAAGLIANDDVPVGRVARQAKRLVVDAGMGRETDVALVDLALIDTTFIGARAVQDPGSIAEVIACIAEPASTGLSSIVGRVLPIGRGEPGAAHLRLGPDGAPLRVPISPGAFSTVRITSARRLMAGETVCLEGPGVLAFDGERHQRLESDERVRVTVDDHGPRVIDVPRSLRCAVANHSISAKDIHLMETDR